MPPLVPRPHNIRHQCFQANWYVNKSNHCQIWKIIHTTLGLIWSQSQCCIRPTITQHPFNSIQPYTVYCGWFSLWMSPYNIRGRVLVCTLLSSHLSPRRVEAAPESTAFWDFVFKAYFKIRVPLILLFCFFALIAERWGQFPFFFFI